MLHTSTPAAIQKNTAQGDFFTKTPLIQLKNVVKTYANGMQEFTALNGINEIFYDGEYIGIIGKSGAGKTTLVNMLSGVDQLTSGEVIINDISIHKLNESKMALWRGKNMGVVFQFFQLLPMLNLLDNIMLPMDFCHLYHPRKSFERAMYLLELVELEEHAYKLPSTISGGQQQRLAIARALANDPPIIVGDEPTGSLDSNTAETVFKVFDELVRQGKTIILVSHDPSLTHRVTRTVLMADGEIINEYIARTFPLLSHRQMLKATHNVLTEEFQPGEIIFAQDTPVEYFSIVTHGEIEVSYQIKKGYTITLTNLKPGDCYGDIEMICGGNARITLRTGNEPVRSIKLDRQAFNEILLSSEPTRDHLTQLAQEKLVRFSTSTQKRDN